MTNQTRSPKRLAQRGQADVSRVEAIAVRSARRATAQLRRDVVASFRAHTPFHVAPAVRNKLGPVLVRAAAVTHAAGMRRSVLMTHQATTAAQRVAAREAARRPWHGLQLDLYSDVVALIKKTLDVNIDLISKQYGPGVDALLEEFGSALEGKIGKKVGELIVSGLTTPDAVGELIDYMEEIGLGGAVKSSQLETIFRTELQTAFNAGRWQQDQDPAIQEILWGYKYVTAGDDRVREDHEALDGTTLPKDDPFWDTYWPPNGWNCRCQVIPVFEEREEVPPAYLPEPEPGFGQNPGKAVLGLSMVGLALAFSEDQPRDEKGQWTSAGGYNGPRVDERNKPKAGGDFAPTPLKPAKGKAVREALSNVYGPVVSAYGKTEEVDAADLHTPQKTVNVETVKKYLSDPHAEPAPAPAGRPNNDLLAVRAAGQLVVINGNHRAAAAALAGRKLKMTVVDMDAAMADAVKVRQEGEGIGLAIMKAANLRKAGKLSRGLRLFGAVLELEYNPDQPRDETGKWTAGGGVGGGPVGKLETVGSLGGSTGAKKVMDSEGTAFVQKAGASKGHAENEYHANKIYEAMGVPVPESHLVDGTLVTEHIDGKPLSSLSTLARAEAEDKLRENFVADAMLGNWDVVGMSADNVLVDENGTPYRVDNGGSLSYRAKGASKGGKWNGDLTELDTMRTANNEAGKIYSKVTEDDIRAQGKALLQDKDKIMAAVPEKDKAVMEARFKSLEKRVNPPAAAAKTDLADKLIKAHEPVPKPEPPPATPKAPPKSEATLDNAAKGVQAQAEKIAQSDPGKGLPVGSSKHVQAYVEHYAAELEGQANLTHHNLTAAAIMNHDPPPGKVLVDWYWSKEDQAKFAALHPGKEVKVVEAAKYIKKKYGHTTKEIAQKLADPDFGTADLHAAASTQPKGGVKPASQPSVKHAAPLNKAAQILVDAGPTQAAKLPKNTMAETGALAKHATFHAIQYTAHGQLGNAAKASHHLAELKKLVPDSAKQAEYLNTGANKLAAQKTKIAPSPKAAAPVDNAAAVAEKWSTAEKFGEGNHQRQVLANNGTMLNRVTPFANDKVKAESQALGTVFAQHGQSLQGWKGSAHGMRSNYVDAHKAGGPLPKAAQKFEAALDLAPKFEGVTFRGVSHVKPGTDYHDALTTVGNTVTFTAPACSSRSPGVAFGFSGGQTVYRMSGKSAAAVEHIEGFQGEKEQIIRAGTTFKVVGYAHNVTLEGGKKAALVVDLEEVHYSPLKGAPDVKHAMAFSRVHEEDALLAAAEEEPPTDVESEDRRERFTEDPEAGTTLVRWSLDNLLRQN